MAVSTMAGSPISLESIALVFLIDQGYPAMQNGVTDQNEELLIKSAARCRYFWSCSTACRHSRLPRIQELSG